MLRLASYNLHKCRGLTGPHAPERNLAVIAALKPDIIALQEVDFRLGARPEALPRRLIREATGLVPADMTTTGLPKLTVIGVHLGLARSSRRAQLARITAQAARIADDNIVLMGDFNEWHDSRGLESLAGFRVVAPGPSYPAPMPQFRFDRIAMSQHLSLLDHGVFTGARAREASDHLPIWAEIEQP